MDENSFFKQTGSYDSRKDLLIHYLKILHERNMPIAFNDLVMKCLPGGGLPEFESVMTELEKKNWITKTEKDGGPALNGQPFVRLVLRYYSISLDGIDYLISLGIIEDKYKKTKEPDKHHINNYGNIVLGDNPQGITQGFDGGNQWSNNSCIIRESAIATELLTETSKMKIKSSIWSRIYEWTNHKLISMIIFSILGFILARLLTHFGWFK